MNHYFTDNTNTPSREQHVKVKIKNQDFIFITDNGVFSKSGLDFGTRTLLEALPSLEGQVLDFGCGYGPIGIYVKKNNNCIVDMIDINNRSLLLAQKNAELNKVNVNIFGSNIYSSVKNKYNYIISNPPIRVGKEILYKILFEANDHLKNNGELWIVVNKNQGAKSLIKDLSQIYLVELVKKNKGFYVIKAIKH